MADVFGVLSCTASVAAGRAVYAGIAELTGPAGNLEQTSGSLADGLGDAADTMADIPFIGDAVSEPLERAAGAAGGLRDAGAATVELVERTATIVGVLIPLLVVVLAVALWIRPRILWVREADEARAALRLPDGAELLAGRAIALVRPTRIAAHGPELVQRWKDGDPDAAAALARAELERLGLAYTQVEPEG